MSANDLLLIIPGSAFASGAVWFFVIVAALYFARRPAHEMILYIAGGLHKALRLAANSIRNAESRLQLRNREVLLAAGREATERIIEREFERIENTVRKDLAQYPALQRRLSEEITKIDEDYAQSTEVPPDPPGWAEAVRAIANIDAKGDPVVGNILEDIYGSLEKAHEKAIAEHRRSSMERHKILKTMMPHWRKLSDILKQVDRNVNSLLERSKTIGRHMHNYEEILKGSDQAVRLLSSSALSQFFVSAFVLIIAIAGAAINFTLIARPMAEMVGGQTLVGGFKTSEIAALVIILIEISIGLFLMESLRITRLFPVIGALNDKLRIRMVWITFSILFILASVEAGLAFMREILMQDELATSALLRGEDAAAYQAAQFAWITTAAQMGMGFILPFALVFVAIPLETFVHSLRTVLGMIAVGVLRFLAMALRVLGNIFKSTGRILTSGYDLAIFAPLWLERVLTRSQGSGEHSADDSTDRGPVTV
jgi:hypothetical protein